MSLENMLKDAAATAMGEAMAETIAEEVREIVAEETRRAMREHEDKLTALVRTAVTSAIGELLR